MGKSLLGLTWLARLSRRPRLEPEEVRALAKWRALPAPSPREAVTHLRWVVVDVESSGLDVWHDRLIAIGAVAVHGTVIELADGLDVVLRQEAVSDTANILVHGIGGTAQRTGLPPVAALLDFLTWAGKDPLVAFHAAFDTLMIGRALRTFLGLKWSPPALDLADLLPALFPDGRDCRQLDDWLARFGIPNDARHQALADAYATAQLWQIALTRAQAAGYATWGDLARLQREQRALRRLEAGL
jgi:DNA polymerase-3 subunit epsilon